MTKKLSNGHTSAERILNTYEKACMLGDKCPLDARERSIIERYYGFYNNAKHTLEEIGVEEGITRERVRQIKHYALVKIGANEK